MLPRAVRTASPRWPPVYLPEKFTISTAQGGTEITAADRMDLERARPHSLHQISDFVTQMDRSSGRDRQRVTSLPDCA